MPPCLGRVKVLQISAGRRKRQLTRRGARRAGCMATGQAPRDGLAGGGAGHRAPSRAACAPNRLVKTTRPLPGTSRRLRRGASGRQSVAPAVRPPAEAARAVAICLHTRLLQIEHPVVRAPLATCRGAVGRKSTQELLILYWQRREERGVLHHSPRRAPASPPLRRTPSPAAAAPEGYSLWVRSCCRLGLPADRTAR